METELTEETLAAVEHELKMDMQDYLEENLEEEKTDSFYRSDETIDQAMDRIVWGGAFLITFTLIYPEVFCVVVQKNMVCWMKSQVIKIIASSCSIKRTEIFGKQSMKLFQ